MKPIVRIATLADREALHSAHMRSIREICIKDHGPEEIKGWGYRELGERWIKGINDGLVWVVELDGNIEGIAAVSFPEQANHGYINALYLTPEVVGMGVANTMIKLMLDCVQERHLKEVLLDSTITAHGFYKKHGFTDTGPAVKNPIGGVPVTSIPMKLILSTP